ncbi:MAG: shikimate dehydrogenase [Alphaproteobacteria bacterium]|nr:shikimate dehydrogenase [Alphaproteobacteria bacterium]
MSGRVITGRTKVLAVLGNPIAHSLSPPMHNAWLAAAGIDATYVALPIEGDVFAALPSFGLYGANVTVPHKERAAAIATQRDEAVARLGAANVLRFGPNGVAAFNTDAPGFVASLDEAAPGWRDRVKTALVIGAGGAARAIAWGLAAAGVEKLLVSNRTEARALEVCAVCPRAAPWPWAYLGDAFAKADLIVNATSLGLAGGPSPDWPIEAAAPHALVVDAVYKPLETPLLAQARARGLATVDGLGMLIHQGALAFEIWFGVKPDTRAARGLLNELLARG